MRSYRAWFCLVLCLVFVTGLSCIDQAQSAPQSDNLIASQLSHEGIIRKFYIHAPSSYDPGKKIPAVFVFHEMGQNAPEMAEVTGFNTISEEGNFLVVYPQAVKEVWNDGRKSSWAHLYDDLGFVDKLIDRLELKWNVDRSRIYACGLGNGGFFCQSLAVNLSDKFAAVSSVAATMPEIFFHKRRPLGPLSVLFILGMKDPLVPFDGGFVEEDKKFRKIRSAVVSASQAVEYWSRGNKCSQNYEHGFLPDLDPTDKTRVRWVHYKDCQGHTEVVLLAVEEGGHSWPGARKNLSQRKYGLTCKDFDASHEIWRFFSKHYLAGSR